MADTTNSGEFGERADTKAAASKGGKMSGGNNRAGSRSSQTGRGSKAGQAKGGKHSHDNQYTA
jgi:hypothetical protein